MAREKDTLGLLLLNAEPLQDDPESLQGHTTAPKASEEDTDPHQEGAKPLQGNTTAPQGKWEEKEPPPPQEDPQAKTTAEQPAANV